MVTLTLMLVCTMIFSTIQQVRRPPGQHSAMPNLRIETNVSAETIKELNTCLAELSKAVSESTGKPEEYVIVQVIPGLPMMFAGSDAPCASAFFMSIGKISPEENKVSSDIFTSISSYQIFPARPTPLLCIR